MVEFFTVTDLDDVRLRRLGLGRLKHVRTATVTSGAVWAGQVRSGLLLGRSLGP